jgi:DNA ligase-1
MQLNELAAASNRVAETAARNGKIAILAEALRASAPGEIAIATAFLMGDLLQGRIGLGPAAVRNAMSMPAAQTPALTLSEVNATFDSIATMSGAGSTRARGNALNELFSKATTAEHDFLARLIYGELRHGALEGVMTDAVSKATAVPLAAVRRALQLSGDLTKVADAAVHGGAAALNAFGVQLFRPLQPMLAQPADDVDDAMRRIDRAALDYKLDGARVQVHKQGDLVRVFTRGLNEVTEATPELVATVLAMPAGELILDGEAIIVEPNGRPALFQKTMQRFGRTTDLDAMQRDFPLSTFFFDALYIDGESLIDSPASARFDALQSVVAHDIIVPRLITDDPADAAAFMRAARAAGHEGIVAKSLDSVYDAGKRGGSWLKVKQADTLDLVILAAEWGHGRRQGWLSNLHLGARDPETNGFVMLGKTFKGLTDAMLEWQTKELLAREIGREGIVVHVRPEIVVEIAYEGVQTSPRYPGGVALRFARVKRYRTDKTADQADTIERVRSLHAG